MVQKTSRLLGPEHLQVSDEDSMDPSDRKQTHWQRWIPQPLLAAALIWIGNGNGLNHQLEAQEPKQYEVRQPPSELKLPAFFSDGMVQQQKSAASIWGWNTPETETSVTFAGQTLRAKANPKGLWKVTFQNLKASKNGAPLTIKSGSTTKTALP